MHTCEIAVGGAGPSGYEECGLPATKNVYSTVYPSGAPRPKGTGQVIWMCDKHYEHAAKTWTKVEF